MDEIKVLLIDDHELIRSGITMLFKEEPGIVVVGEAQNTQEALSVIQKHNVDVIILDIQLEEITGFEIAEVLLKENEELKILMLSMFSDEEYVMKSLACGCKGYLLKRSDTAELVKAVETVAKGSFYFGSGVAQGILEKQAYITQINKGQPEGKKLTKRELDVLVQLAEGLSSKAIAEKLFISVRTVETHRTNILQKLKLQNATQLVRYALKNKLIKLD